MVTFVFVLFVLLIISRQIERKMPSPVFSSKNRVILFFECPQWADPEDRRESVGSQEE